MSAEGSESRQQSTEAEQMIANIDRGSCGFPFHKDVRFANVDGQTMSIWYLGTDRYRVAGQTRVVLSTQNPSNEVVAKILNDTTFSLSDLRGRTDPPSQRVER